MNDQQLLAWLDRIAFRRSTDHARRAARTERTESGYAGNRPIYTPPIHPHEPEGGTQLRSIVTMRAKGFKLHQIATRLGCSESSVKMQLARHREALR